MSTLPAPQRLLTTVLHRPGSTAGAIVRAVYGCRAARSGDPGARLLRKAVAGGLVISRHFPGTYGAKGYVRYWLTVAGVRRLNRP